MFRKAHFGLMATPLVAVLTLACGATAGASRTPGTSLPKIVVTKNLGVVASNLQVSARVPARLINALRNLRSRIAYHNSHRPDRGNRAAVQAYNRRGRALNAELWSLLAQIRRYK